MPTKDEFFGRVAEVVGKVSSAERTVLEFLDYVRDYELNGLDAVDGAAGVVGMLRDAYGTPSEVAQMPDSIAGASLTDPRWALLRDLNEAYRDIPRWTAGELLKGAAGKPRTARELGRPQSEFKPLEVSRVLDLDKYPESERVQISIDNRVSLQALIAALRQLWPQMAARKWVRRTRPLDERTLALIRFVCLEPSGTTWRERMKNWEERHPHRKYGDVRAFQGAFSRAALSLTGSRDGLDAFYASNDPDQVMQRLIRAVHDLGDVGLAEIEKLRREGLSFAEIAERASAPAEKVDEEEVRRLAESTQEQRAKRESEHEQA